MLFAPKNKIVYFDPDGGGSAGNGEGGGQGGAGSNAGAGENKDHAGSVSYTQEQLDQMFAERAKRAGEAAIANLLKKLGVEDTEKLIAQYTEGKKLLDGQKTEAEKLQAALEQTTKQLDQLKAEKEAALAQATEKLLRAAVLTEAASQGFRPEAINDVWLVVDRSKITEKDGDFTGVKDAVEAVAKAKPFWLGAGKDSAGRGTPRPENGKKKEAGALEETRPVLRL